MKTPHVLKLLNGKGGDRPDSDFDPYWLEIGIHIEMEHTTRRDIAKIIAKQHLSEHGSLYYERILEIEEELTQTEDLQKSIGKPMVWLRLD
jgi:hypothetical protein